MIKEIALGSRVKTKTIKSGSNFDNKVGTIVEYIYAGPFVYHVKFDEVVVSGGVEFDGMFFRENEVELISEGS